MFTVHHTDTILQKDSIVVDKYTHGDTIYIMKDRWHVRDKISIKVDTIYKSCADTTYIKVPVKTNNNFFKDIMDRTITVFLAIASIVVLFKFGYNRIKGDC